MSRLRVFSAGWKDADGFRGPGACAVLGVPSDVCFEVSQGWVRSPCPGCAGYTSQDIQGQTAQGA